MTEDTEIDIEIEMLLKIIMLQYQKAEYLSTKNPIEASLALAGCFNCLSQLKEYAINKSSERILLREMSARMQNKLKEYRDKPEEFARVIKKETTEGLPPLYSLQQNPRDFKAIIDFEEHLIVFDLLYKLGGYTLFCKRLY